MDTNIPVTFTEKALNDLKSPETIALCNGEDPVKFHEDKIRHFITTKQALANATSAIVHRGAHKGGNDTNAPAHISGKFKDGDTHTIRHGNNRDAMWHIDL